MQVNMATNQDHNGIELKFSEKPSMDLLAQVKQQGFRWHPGKKLWFAKNTEKRAEFAQKLCGLAHGAEKESPIPTTDKEPLGHNLPNTFGAHYDQIGDAIILKDADVSLGTYTEAFCEKNHLYFRRTYGGDSMTIYDLSNAQKVGKECTSWTIYGKWNDPVPLLSRLSKEGISQISELAEACRLGKEFDGISINEHSSKGLDVFSPFVEVKPLDKVPEKWTKRHFTQALMSGQLFRGEVSYHYTDDYAMDAANEFCTGRGFHMADFAKREIGDWGSCTTCYGEKVPDKHGIYRVHYSEHTNSSNTLWFDLNCNIAEGKARANAREQARKNYNLMMEESCIRVDPSKLSDKKIYEVEYLDMNQNTGIYRTIHEILQGEYLQDRLDPSCCLMDVLSVQELEIQPDLFYSISDFHNRLPTNDTKDDRIIPVGNWEHIVTGKALLELTAEGRYFPDIHIARDAVGPTYDIALDNLEKLANGNRRYMMGGDKTGYSAAILQLQAEYQRSGGIVNGVNRHPENPHKRFQDILENAQQRTKVQEHLVQHSRPIEKEF